MLVVIGSSDNRFLLTAITSSLNHNHVFLSDIWFPTLSLLLSVQRTF